VGTPWKARNHADGPSTSSRVTGTAWHDPAPGGTAGARERMTG
jgi:hypothetical protein